MSISSVNSASLSTLYAADSVTSTTDLTPAANLVSSTVSSATDTSAASVSKKAKLLDQLKKLAGTDPAEFKKVTAAIATQLQSAAQQTSGSSGNALSSLAAKFQQASQTGSLSSLEPAKHHRSGHHGTAAIAASTAYQQASAQGASSTGSTVDSIISSVLPQGTDSTDASIAATSDLFRLPAKAAE